MNPKGRGQGILFGFEVVNGKLVRQGLENFAKSLPEIGIKRIYKAMMIVYNRLGVYPPERPHAVYVKGKGRRRSKARFGSRTRQYVRTYQLRDTRTLTRTELGYVISNNPIGPSGQRYGQFVRGNPMGKGQTGQNKDWELLASMIADATATLPDDVVRAMAVQLSAETAKANRAE